MFESKMTSARVDFLVDALLALESREEGYRLLDDLMTVREIEDLAQRMQVARMLTEKATYAEITQSTGASSATVGRVNRALVYGSDGYRRILERLKNTGENND